MKRLALLLFLPLAAYAQDLSTGNNFTDGDTVNAAALNNSINNATILPTFLSNKGSGAPISSDLFLFYQGGTTSLKQASLGSLFSAGLGFSTKNANTFYSGPASGGSATPTFRTMVPHDTTVATNATVSATLDASLARTFTRTLSANTTFTVANMLDGETISVLVQQAASGGPYTAAWSGIAWRGGTAPVQTATANKRDIYTIIKIGGTGYGSASQNY